MARVRVRAAVRKRRPSLVSKYQGKQPQSIQLSNHLRPASAIIEKLSQQDAPASIQGRGCKRKQSSEDTFEASPDPDQKQLFDRITFWVKERRWPEVPYCSRPTLEMDPAIKDLLATRAQSNLSRTQLSRTQSIDLTSVMTRSDETRGKKSAPYGSPLYELVLKSKGSMMNQSDLGITDMSKTLCRTLLETEQTIPKDSLFGDDVFSYTCRMVRNKNEARIIQDITRLIVPRAETFAAFGAKHLEILTESVNEGWNSSNPLIGARPQPDYSVGFKEDAFTKDQLDKLSPFIGDLISGDKSFLMATHYIYFPFLTCEVKSNGQLDVADRQNAHSMTLAVRGIAKLFRAVNREGEVHRQILAFSISHDNSCVRIYGHYPVINGKDTTYYRHIIRKFDFTELDGRDKWAAYQFTKNVYDKWMPAHFKNICSAIDQLPTDLDLDVPARSEAAGLPQDLGNPMQLDAGSASMPV
ncbi:hypothetical protein DL768_002596 [Monosporascus sp. mg162]|nr:hypothetical protein DL768_002596 [Monosporascus sp. mg162]